MKKWTLIIVLLLTLFAQSARAWTAAGVKQKEVQLIAKIRLQNRGNTAVSQYLFSLTYPGDIINQQRVIGISQSGPEKYKTISHQNGVDRYLQFSVGLPAGAVVEREFSFKIHLQRFDQRNQRGSTDTSGNAYFLTPSTYVESSATEVLTISQKIVRAFVDDESRLKAAYVFPQQILSYRLIDNSGALFAIRNGYGDCTEYASVFAALARAMGYPARLTSEFNFSDLATFDVPNHHAAEVFLNGNWIPVDPNLALDVNSGYGFGKTGLDKIVLKRDGSWVWSVNTPGTSSQYRNAYVDATLSWSVLGK